MKRNNRPCADCPFREKNRTKQDRDLLANVTDQQLAGWVCHKTLMATYEGDYDAERLCAGAQITSGRMSQRGRPKCSVP